MPVTIYKKSLKSNFQDFMNWSKWTIGIICLDFALISNEPLHEKTYDLIKISICNFLHKYYLLTLCDHHLKYKGYFQAIYRDMTS